MIRVKPLASETLYLHEEEFHTSLYLLGRSASGPIGPPLFHFYSILFTHHMHCLYIFYLWRRSIFKRFLSFVVHSKNKSAQYKRVNSINRKRRSKYYQKENVYVSVSIQKMANCASNFTKRFQVMWRATQNKIFLQNNFHSAFFLIFLLLFKLYSKYTNIKSTVGFIAETCNGRGGRGGVHGVTCSWANF